MPDRLMVFIDYQNTYRGARRAFEPVGAPHEHGQINPAIVGALITNLSSDRVLVGVHVYCGMPDSHKQPRPHAARSRQTVRRSKSPGVYVHWRPLRYPKDFGKDPKVRPEEKGIDVELAIGYVMEAQGYDVGVLFSADTDLRPALYAVEKIKGPDAIEVAAWQPSNGYPNRLSIGEKSTRRPICRLLDEAAYREAQDLTDYNIRR